MVETPIPAAACRLYALHVAQPRVHGLRLPLRRAAMYFPALRHGSGHWPAVHPCSLPIDVRLYVTSPVPPQMQTGPTPHYSTTAEAKDAFKQLLTDASISSGMSWEETMRLIVGDRR